MTSLKTPSQAGQSLIESIFVLKALTIVIGGLLSVVYLSYSKHVTTYALIKNNLCLEVLNKKKSTCEKELQTSLKNLLFFHKSVRVRSQQKSTSNKSSATVSFLRHKTTWSKKLNKN